MRAFIQHRKNVLLLAGLSVILFAGFKNRVAKKKALTG